MAVEKETISETAPSFSLSKVLSTIKEQGPIRALEDPEHGPHVHLTLLLATVFIVSILIILITKFII